MRAEDHAFADHADAGCRDEQLVAGASLHDFGVAGDDFDSRLLGRSRHRSGYLPQQIDGHALFDDRGA